MMNIMDRHLTKHPTEGVVSMVYLLLSLGFLVGPKRIRRLIRIMGRHTFIGARILPNQASKSSLSRIY